MTALSATALPLLLLLLESRQRSSARVNVPAEGQSAFPVNKPYKFTI